MPRIRPVLWKKSDSVRSFDAFCDGTLVLLDQTLLPTEVRYIECRTIESVWEGIKMLRVRGAPAIGIAAAFGVCVGLQTVFRNADGTRREPSEDEFFARLVEVVEIPGHPYFEACQFHPEFKSRPTAPHPLFNGLVKAALKRHSLRAGA